MVIFFCSIYVTVNVPGRQRRTVNKCMAFSYGHWQSDFEFDPEEWFGFVYRIVDNETGKEYIGKKQFKSRIRKKVAGRKNRKVVFKDNGWEKYTGSSKSLNEAISAAPERFSYHIESLHETKASLYYAEVLLQIKEDVLRARLPNGEYKYHNGLIGAVKFRPPEPTEKELQFRRRRP